MHFLLAPAKLEFLPMQPTLSSYKTMAPTPKPRANKFADFDEKAVKGMENIFWDRHVIARRKKKRLTAVRRS